MFSWYIVIMLQSIMPVLISAKNEITKNQMDCHEYYSDAFGHKIDWTNKDDGWTEKGRKKFLEFTSKIECSMFITEF